MDYTFQATYKLKNEELLTIRANMMAAALEYLEDVYGILPPHLSAETMMEIAKKALEAE